MFVTGQTVVCVNDTFSDEALVRYRQIPVKGRHYVIRSVFLGMLGAGETEVCVLLVGVVNPRDDRGREAGFVQSRFRPLDEDSVALRSETPAPPAGDEEDGGAVVRPMFRTDTRLPAPAMPLVPWPLQRGAVRA